MLLATVSLKFGLVKVTKLHLVKVLMLVYLGRKAHIDIHSSVIKFVYLFIHFYLTHFNPVSRMLTPLTRTRFV